MSVVAINPAAQLPHKTLFHELGHQVLGHVSEGERSETETLSRNLEEAEAEGAAALISSGLQVQQPPGHPQRPRSEGALLYKARGERDGNGDTMNAISTGGGYFRKEGSRG